MSYAKSLRNILKDKNELLFNRLHPIIETSKNLLPYTVSKFPYYTPHFSVHSDHVEENLNCLIPDAEKLKMDENEIFFLLIGAWLHDWGMIATKDEDAEEVRKQHHVRTESNFEKQYQMIHLSLDEARIIGRICRGHRKDDLHSMDYNDKFLGINKLIRIRFLAALLRLADECDITANRTPEILYYNLRPEGASDDEFKKHLMIPGIGFPDQFPYKIILNCVTYSPKGVIVIEQVRKKIQDELNSIKSILALNGVQLEYIETEIDSRGFINKPIGFELDKKKIVELLIGKAIYSRNDVAIRELLQNSVDACRTRSIKDHEYQPQIDIEFDNEKITFKDNGIGMNFEDALSHFSKKGNSFFISKEFENMPENEKFNPISKFGIGVLSSFQIAKEMIVLTKKENSSSCKFSISDITEGWRYEESVKKIPGTEITLVLNEKGKMLDLLKSLKFYAKKVEIPIRISNLTTFKTQEFEQIWSYNIPEVISCVDHDFDQRTGEIEKPEIVLMSGSPDIEVSFYIFPRTRFDMNNCFIINRGFYVGNFDLFPTHVSNWIALINIKSDIVDLMVSRDNFELNEKYEQFLDLLYENLLSQAEKFIDDNFITVNEIDKCVEFSNLMKNFISDFGTQPDCSEARLIRKLILRKKYPVFTKNGLAVISGDELFKMRISHLYHYNLPINFYSENIELISQSFNSKKMKKDEIIVFEFGPRSEFLLSPRKFVCAFCEMMKSNRQISIECCDLKSMLRKLKFKKIKTDLDILLPKGSYFSDLPESLRSIVIEGEESEFSPALDSVAESDVQKANDYHILIAKILLTNDPELVNFYEEQYWFDQRRYTLVSSGYFIYDFTDTFLSFLISRSNLILSDPNKKNLCERYLKVLAVFYQNSHYQGIRPRSEAGSIILLEKTLGDFLNYPDKYIEITERAGNLASIYNIR